MHIVNIHIGPFDVLMTGMVLIKRKSIAHIYLRSTVPDVVTLAQRFKQQGYQTANRQNFHLDNPGTIGTSMMISFLTQTINPYGIDKLNEYLIESLVPRRGGTLSWLKSDDLDIKHTDGIAATEAIEQLDGLQHPAIIFLGIGVHETTFAIVLF